MLAASLLSQEPAMPPLIWILFAGPLSWLRQALLVSATYFKPEDWSQSDQRFGWTLPNKQPLWPSSISGGQAV